MRQLADLVSEWLDLHHGKTRASYQNTIHKFLSFISVGGISDIQTRHVRDWLDSLSEADSTKVKHLSILKAFFAYVISLENPPISRSPIPKQFKLPIPKDTLVERILTPEEVDEMIAVTTDFRNRLILKTLYLTGIRVSELCGLKWKDGTSSRGGGGQINIYGKGGRTRRVHVPQELWVELIQLRNEMRSDSPMFPSATGAALAPSHIDRVVKRAAAAQLEKALHVSAHWFRHSHATHALDEGVPVHLVQATLGHTSLDTTSKYLHVRPDRSSGEVLVKRWSKSC
jgi:integrase/recombinase XerD